jgi:hypothetical protein
MKKSNVVFVVVLSVFGLIAMGIGGLVLLFYVSDRGFGARPPTDAEKKLVVTTAALADHIGTEARCEKLGFKRNLDGTREISAEYDSTNCAKDALSFISTAEITSSAREARESFALAVGAYKVGARIGGTTVHDAPNLLSGGDQRYSALVRKGDNVVGNVFVVRQGRVVHALFIIGLYFDEPAYAQELLAPVLEESARQFGRYSG